MNRTVSPAATAALAEPQLTEFVVPEKRIDADAARVVRKLVSAGYTAYLVGGCVRDLMLNRTPKDFDVATSARPGDVRNLFRNCRVIGRRFRLAHVIFGEKVIEVATFRKDPGNHVDLASDWSHEVDEAPRRAHASKDDLLIRHDNVFGNPPEDALRRDFTINALFYDLQRHQVIDYVGGLEDIERRLIRTIGDADVRFREDPVRILRAIKFAARLDLTLDDAVYEAIVAHRDELLRAARPRLFEEFLRLLRGGAARASFELAWDTGVLSVVLPELSAFLDDEPAGRSRTWQRLEAIDREVANGQCPPDAVLFAALLLDPTEEYLQGSRDLVNAITEFYEDIQERLAISRRLYDRVRQIAVVQRRFRMGKSASMKHREWYGEAELLFDLDRIARASVRPMKVEPVMAAGDAATP
ncbi:MAG: polynucleotide adenylyltransferase PcnB [Myxococcales bacterium]|nr:polynucleotide adenylyltransferase PcnB [Myxococcales bacterium]